ncbi:MAG: 7-cyano-7-deazaguanine synthase QueC [Deltaproteobacteria bacterium]|nr:7-cyano-7-deazaguanine synthase QueC [Deltaproteobacteria bacterium]
MKDAAVLLLSGGLDSAVNAALAVRQHVAVHAVTFDYGQRAGAREIAAARTMATHYGMSHAVIALPWMAELSASALVDSARALPEFRERSSLDDPERTSASAAQVWVPNRNGCFLNIGAAIAEANGWSWIVAGFNAEEGKTFPDNTAAFVDKVNAVLSMTIARPVRVVSYTQTMTKREIVKTAMTLHLPIECCWPCYADSEEWCGVCESCARFRRALQESGYAQPLDFANDPV